MTYNAAERRSVREAEKAAKLADQNRLAVLSSLAATAPGRQWLWEQLEAAHLFTSSYNDNPQRMAFIEGERNQGLRLMTDFMTACPDEFILAMREANERRTQRDATGRTAGEPTGGEDTGGDDQGSADGAEG